MSGFTSGQSPPREVQHSAQHLWRSSQAVGRPQRVLWTAINVQLSGTRTGRRWFLAMTLFLFMPVLIVHVSVEASRGHGRWSVCELARNRAYSGRLKRDATTMREDEYV